METAVCSPIPAARVEQQRMMETPRQYLIFTLNGDVYAIEIMCIREIIEYGLVTEVPMMPDAIRGVINLRGAVVPLIDLSARFGRGRSTTGRRSCSVILEVAGQGGGAPQTLGIVVDAVNEVLDIPAAEIEPAPAFGARLRTDFIAGMGRIGERFVIILDLARVLSFEELARLAELARPEAGAGQAGEQRLSPNGQN